MSLTKTCQYRILAAMIEIAEKVISKFGDGNLSLGRKVLAGVLDRHPSRILRLTAPREKGGTEGFFQHKDMCLMLEFARNSNVDLSPSDFFPEDI